MIGPNANLSSLDSGYYGPSDPCQVQQWPNLVDAVSKHARSTVTALAIPSVNSNSTSGIAAAVGMVRQLQRYFGPSLAYFPTRCHPTRAVHHALLGARACGMIVSAYNLIL